MASSLHLWAVFSLEAILHNRIYSSLGHLKVCLEAQQERCDHDVLHSVFIQTILVYFIAFHDVSRIPFLPVGTRKSSHTWQVGAQIWGTAH